MIPIVVLHGSNGSAATMKPLATELARFIPVEVPDLAGHGGRPLPEKLTLDVLADDLVAWLDARGLSRVYLCGYSLGASLALYVAMRHPARVAGICVIAAKYVFDDAALGRWLYLSDPARLHTLPDGRPAQLEKRHHPQDWQAVLSMNRAYWRDLARTSPLTPANIAAIKVPVMVVSAENDQIVPAAETRALAALLKVTPRMFPGIAHPLEALPLMTIAEEVVEVVARLGEPA